MPDSIEKISKKLKKEMKKKRYRHTMGVRYTAQALAMRFGEDISRAGYAGVLHDCAKNLSDEKMLSECRKFGVSCTETEQKQVYLLHAKLGAKYAACLYGIDDLEILSAIRWHTTGKPGMSKLEKILYIADYIEPNRKAIPGLEEIRHMAFQNLDETMYLILRNTLEYLRENTKEAVRDIEEHTIAAYEFYRMVHETSKEDNCME
ncbi:MAG: bis(5'-nucleosyl)-tetraphosphatase (symmetrical) YqeK [Clostridiaceae bacterium]|nr:bis(5'-nucleosyl)-tetraphosphatase (symmetrical) YqeK [Clostridiaceae bacterium]